MVYTTPTKLPGLEQQPGPRTASIASTPRAYGTPRQMSVGTPREMTGSESSFDEKYSGISEGSQDYFPRPPRTAPSGSLRQRSRPEGQHSAPLNVPRLHNLPAPGSVDTPRSGRGSWPNSPNSAKRKFYFDQGQSFAHTVPHGVSGSEEVPQLKNFAVSLPGWINQGVTEQRTHLKLYYCDMLGRPKLEPPIRPDAVEWEVEKMKEFVLNARPKTRLDAYPLLVITQDILQRVAMDKIKIVSDREASLQAELEKLLATIRDLEVQVREGKDTISKLKLGAMMSSARKGLEGEALLAKEHEERERALKEIQDMMQKSDAEKKALEEEAERLKKLLAEQRKQLENANRQIKIAQQQAEATMKQYDSDVKRKPGDLFASWTDADKKAILLEQLLNNSELLGHVGLDAISKAWTRDGSASKQLLAARDRKSVV